MVFYYKLGVAYLQMGKLEEATGEFRKAIEIRPDYVKAHEKLSETFKKIGIDIEVQLILFLINIK